MKKLILLSLLAASFAHAADVDNNIPFFSGYIDTSYNYLVRNHLFTSGVYNRVNDLTQNGFTLQAVSVTFAKQPTQGVGGVLDLFAGRDAYSIDPYGWNGYYGSQTLGFTVPQAYLQYATGPYIFIGGVFNALPGAESYHANIDSNFSRSILDGYAEPGILIGARGFYLVNDQLKFNLGLNNGWSGFRDTGKQPSVEYGAAYDINKIFTVQVQGLSGEQRLINRTVRGSMGRRNFINLIAVCHATERLDLILSGDYGEQNKALDADDTIGRVDWEGLTGYVNYQFNERWRTSLRGEIYKDSDGYTTDVNQNWREITITVAYVPFKQAELRLETRRDFSNVNSFMNATGPGSSNNQQSYALEALYSF